VRRCDIVLVAWNQLEYTKLCIKSIMRHTDVPSRLIIIDNGSAPDTKDYLRSLRSDGPIEVKVIFNARNLGAIKARNMGIGEFEADYLCLLDNDVEVTPGWLSKMIKLAEDNPEIGVINPSSNNFGQVPPPDMGLDEYAKSLEMFRGEYIEIGTGISFCMLVRGEVVKRIGRLDENFEVMFYEDTDYSMRANREGYRSIIQKDVYVWHHGHKTSGRLKRHNEIADKNRDIFYKKWGRPLRVMWCSTANEKSDVAGEALAGCIELARDGNFIYLFIRSGEIKTRKDFFKTYSLIEHANVHIILYAGKGFGWFCLWRLLKRRKKRYDLVIADDGRITSLIGRFRLFHRAAILTSMDFDGILKTAHRLKFK
jgi:GT2 family glycosyltransferase